MSCILKRSGNIRMRSMQLETMHLHTQKGWQIRETWSIEYDSGFGAVRPSLLRSRNETQCDHNTYGSKCIPIETIQNLNDMAHVHHQRLAKMNLMPTPVKFDSENDSIVSTLLQHLIQEVFHNDEDFLSSLDHSSHSHSPAMIPSFHEFVANHFELPHLSYHHSS